MSIMNKSPLFLNTLALFTLSACGMQGQLNDMHDKTAQMADTTAKMSQTTTDMAKTTTGMAKTTDKMATTTEGMATTTDHMATTTDGMADVTGHMYLEGRQAGTVGARKDALEAMKKSVSLKGKAANATVYFESFEYELWKPELETAADLENMKAEATKQFMASVQDYVGNMKAFALTSTHNDKQMNLYALAATLHYYNREEYIAPGKKPTTMLSMIEDALNADADLKAGRITQENIPTYQQMILREKDTAVYLLRIRQNFLSALPLSLLDDTDHKNIFQNMLQIGWIALFHWDSKIPSMDITQIKFLTEVLSYARESREFLQSLHLAPQTDPVTWGIYLNMKAPTAASLTGDKSEVDLPKALQGLNDEVNHLIKQD